MCRVNDTLSVYLEVCSKTLAPRTVRCHKNGLFLQLASAPNKRKKTCLPKRKKNNLPEIVALLTETLEGAPWLGQVESVEGEELTILWMEGSYSSPWKVATICKGSKTLPWRDMVSVNTIILIYLTENSELTDDIVVLIKDTYSSYF